MAHLSLTPGRYQKSPAHNLLVLPLESGDHAVLTATLTEPTFWSFHQRKTDIWVDWKVGCCPIWLGTGHVNPRAPLPGWAELAQG